ncbi:MAG: hypothetical protein K0R98_1161 [Rickettsiaceae bacterium]|jgi:uncharacterized protein (DUF924 family)|nr:hypothetical protein [Rickettsiaceae bacterium]
MAIATTQEILDFWFAEENKHKWFEKDSDFDSEITKRFLATYKEAKKKYDPLLEHTPQDMLATVIVLDQFPRNMFRGKKEAYATDVLALKIADDAIRRAYDKELSAEQRKFLYMPFMHSEDIKHQRYAVALFARLGDTISAEYANQHKGVIVRFGRFPHRNSALERKSTEKEIKFLAEAGSGF